MVWPNRGAFGAIGGYGLNVLKLLQESYRCCRYAPAAGSTGLRRQPAKPMRHRPYSLSRPRAGPSSLRLSSPPDARGWRARGRCRRRFKIRISLRKCGSASRRATRTSLKCPGSFAAVFFRFALSRKRNACAGPRFPGRRLDRGFPDPRLPSRPHRDCRHYLTASPARNCGQASTAAPSASSWRAAHIGHQAEPRRRPSAWEERSSPARGRRIRLHHQTPHDDAPRSSRT
jgi:hypothetical protein